MKFKIYDFETLESTNKYAMENAENLANFSVIITKNQTAGKGRNGKKWVSNDNENLYFSLVLKPENFEISQISGIPQLMALAVYQTLHKAGINNSWIKWPNDLLVNNKKICGILCESKINQLKINTLVIGVGINVNATKSSMELIDSPATSMQVECSDQKPFAVKEILHLILDEFDKNYTLWQEPDKREIFQELWRQSSQLIGKAVVLIDSSRKIYGTVADFTQTGELILHTESGFQTFSYGDLSLRQLSPP